jgi:hypothetical protein
MSEAFRVAFFGNPSSTDESLLEVFRSLGNTLGQRQLPVMTSGITGSNEAVARGVREEGGTTVGYCYGQEAPLSAYYSHTSRIADLKPHPPMPLEMEFGAWLGTLLSQDGFIFDGSSDPERVVALLSALILNELNARTQGAQHHPKRIAIVITPQSGDISMASWLHMIKLFSGLSDVMNYVRVVLAAEEAVGWVVDGQEPTFQWR